MMETWVLIPPELSLVLQSSQALVMTRVPVAQGRRWSPFQGTVRLGVIPASAASEPDNEVRSFCPLRDSRRRKNENAPAKKAPCRNACDYRDRSNENRTGARRLAI